MTGMGVLAGLLAALALIALVGWSAVTITWGRREDGAGSIRSRPLGRALLTVAAVLAGACLQVLTVASFAEHL